MDNNNYDAIIIGAGIGGLTAGNILAKNGMKVLILEKNHVPGGAVSTFYRKGYPIDISHSLGAFKQGAFIHNTFDYLGITKNIDVVELEKVFIYLRNNKPPFYCYTDINKYGEEIKKYLKNENSKILKDSCNIWKNEILKSYYNPNLAKLLLYPLLFPHLYKYRNYNFDQFLNKYTSCEELKNIISCGTPYFGLSSKKVSALYMICLLGSYHEDKCFFVKGGFGRIPQTLADNFTKYGGKIIYKTKINEILIKNKIAYGVLDDNNNVFKAKNIISNIDGKRTFLDLINPNNLHNKFLNRISKLTMSCSTIQVHIFATANVEKEFLSAGSIIMPFIDLEKKLRDYLGSNLAPCGNPQVMLSIQRMSDFGFTNENETFVFNFGWFYTNYNLWKEFSLNFNEKEYNDIKNVIIQSSFNTLKKYWKLKDLKFAHVLTPISFEKWLNNTEGAIYDFECTPSQMLLNRLKHRTPIKNLYIVGSKTFPGIGIPGAVISAVCLSDILLNRKLTNGKVVLKNN